ncbi:PREDICTED: fibronectin-like [Nanorana parkeri]|uniref:fibronectin-like n=1 Tax=Nanorana parkeri TaxID=125878 RepID=UPI000854E2FC|nr:PREDICTED: fibronectin-like [Nanorana parkeri]
MKHPSRISMDSLTLHLLIFKSIFQIVRNMECGERDIGTVALMAEWSAFPEGFNPDNYFFMYHPINKQIILQASAVQQVYNTYTSLNNLEEKHTYNVTIKSMKDGNTLSVRSFLTKTFALSDIKIVVTSTSVSFSWSKISSHFTVSIMMNNSSGNMLKKHDFYEWNNLIPGCLYTFIFTLKQHYLGFINVTQNIDITVITGLCSEGWSAFKGSCYRLSMDRNSWNIAEHNCKALHPEAHLVKVHSIDEQLFLSSFLHMKNEVILLWSGLSDEMAEGELVWTDGSSYDLDTSEVPLLSNLPENETDCYALQQNATGPNYFYTAFFCRMELPYLCEYEFPEVPENFTYFSEAVTESQVLFHLDNLPDFSHKGYYPFIKYYFDNKYDDLERVNPNSTYISLKRLSPAQIYHVILCMRDSKGSQYNLSPVIPVQTRPLYPKNLTATKISSSSLSLKWNPPANSFDSSRLCGYKLTVVDVKENILSTLMEAKNRTSTTITNLRPYNKYKIFIQTVGESGVLSSVEKIVSLVTGISPPQRVLIKPDEVQEESVVIHWESPQETRLVYIEVKPVLDISEPSSYFAHDNNSFVIGSLVPGMTYEIGLSAVINGNKSEKITIQQTLRPKPVTLVVPYEQSTHAVVLFVQVQAVGVFDGIFIINTNDPKRNMSFPPLTHGTFAIDQLTPGTQYKFQVHTKSKNMLSTPYKMSSVKTCLASPSNVHEGEVTDTSIQVIWDRAEGGFQQYEIICTNCSETFMVQKVTKERAIFASLIPGTVYAFTVSTEKELFRDSPAVTVEIQTSPSIAGNISFTVTTDSVNVTWQVCGQSDGYIIFLTSETINRTETVLRSKRSRLCSTATQLTAITVKHITTAINSVDRDMLIRTWEEFSYRIDVARAADGGHIEHLWHTFNHLLPGVDYHISIFSTFGSKKSPPAVLCLVTAPEPPSALQILGQEESTIYLSWEPPRGGHDMFQKFSCTTFVVLPIPSSSIYCVEPEVSWYMRHAYPRRLQE